MGKEEDQGGDGLEVEEGRWGMERIRVEMGGRGVGMGLGGSGKGRGGREGGWEKRGKGDGEMGGKGRKGDRKGGTSFVGDALTRCLTHCSTKSLYTDTTSI